MQLNVFIKETVELEGTVDHEDIKISEVVEEEVSEVQQPDDVIEESKEEVLIEEHTVPIDGKNCILLLSILVYVGGKY